MCNTTTTTIAGQPPLPFQPPLNNSSLCNTGYGFHNNGYDLHSNGNSYHSNIPNGNGSTQQHTQFLTQSHPFPNGITYTFHPVGQNGYHTCPSAYFNNIQGITEFNQQLPNFQQLQKHALESLLLHEQFKENPFKLQFHRDGQTNTEDITRTTDVCMCKDGLLNQIQQHSTLKTDTNLKPEQLFPECVQRKQLDITPSNTSSNHGDKGTQYSPSRETIEVQTNAVRICKCKKKSDESKENQTETKKVTFDKPYTSRNKQKARRRAPRSRNRQVDEDSSDSSQDRSSSSKSSEDSK